MPPSTSPEPNTKETPTPTSGDNTMLMGILAYLGPLVIIPYLTSKEVPFVYFHVKQGIVLLALEVVIYVAANMMMFSFLSMFLDLIPIINIALIIFSIIGIVNVVQKQEKELPIIGGLAKHVPF